MKSKILGRNKILFNYILKKILLTIKKNEFDSKVLVAITKLSEYVWHNHPGFLFSVEIENYLLELGAKIKMKNYRNDNCLLNEVNDYLERYSEPTVFHIASELADFGGHTRIQIQIIKRTPKKYNQVLVILNQSEENYPEILHELDGKKVKIVSLNNQQDYISKALILRKITEHANFIVLNHHPYDVVPLLAFSVETNCPVLVHNHAHSWFWLGIGITDVLLSYTSYHKKFNENKRMCREHYLLNATQIDSVTSKINKTDKHNAKQTLGLNPNFVTLLSLGTEEKYIPNRNYNFFNLVQKILEKYPNVEIVVIGLNKYFKYISPALLENDRIRFCGYLKDVSIHYKACDIFIESMPLPSFGSTILSILEGQACPLYKYGKNGIYSSDNFINSESYFRYLKQAKTQKEYFDNLDLLISNKAVREEIANDLKNSIIKTYYGQSLDQSIGELFDYSKGIKHKYSLANTIVPKPDESDNEIAEGSMYKTMSEALDHFREELNFSDKLELIFKCFIRGIHFKENLGLIFKLMLTKISKKNQF
jgi:hypothetical protein